MTPKLFSVVMNDREIFFIDKKTEIVLLDRFPFHTFGVHADASEGMTEFGVQDMTVSEPKMTIFKPLVPTTAQMATSVIQNTNDFKRTVYCLCIKS